MTTMKVENKNYHKISTFKFLQVVASGSKTSSLIIMLMAAMTYPSYSSNSGESFVVGGQDADIDQYPYTVAIFYQGDQFASGVVIAENWVITAAHVVMEMEPSRVEDFVLVFGQTNLDRTGFAPNYNHGFGDFRIAVPTEVVIHPDFQYLTDDEALAAAEGNEDLANELQFGNDIALFRLGVYDRVTDDRIIPFLGERDNDRLEVGLDLDIAGWGQTSLTSDDLSRILQVATLPIGRFLPMNIGILDGEPGTNSRSSLYGDSGGPVVATFGGQPFLVGIIAGSYSDESRSMCETYFVRTDRHANWIERVTGAVAGRFVQPLVYHDNVIAPTVIDFGLLTGGAFGFGLLLRRAVGVGIRVQQPQPGNQPGQAPAPEDQPLLHNQEPNMEDDDVEKFDIYEEDRRARMRRAKNVKSSSSKKDC